MDNDTSAREEKLLAAKKKLKKYQKKKASNASSVDKSSTESATVSNTRRSSMSSDAGSVKTDYTDGKVSEIITNSEENIAQNDVTPNITGVEINQNQNAGDHHNQAEFTQQRLSPSTNNSSSHGSTVEELQPVDYHQPSGKESQTDLLTTPTDGIASTENLSKATAENFSDDQTITFEGLANICRMQQQTITLLMEEKTALASELEKFSAMANRFKSSEELLKEGQLLVDALRRQNAELEEKVRTVEDQLKETNSQNENIIEKLQLQNARIQQLENDNKQQLSQLNVKDSIIEQLKAEKNNNFSASNQVETLQKILKDKEERIKELETESTNLKLRFTNLEQQLSEKQEKILALERDSGEKQQTDGSLYHSKDDDKQKEPLSSPTTTDRRISLSQFSSDFEIGRCSGCIGEIVII